MIPFFSFGFRWSQTTQYKTMSHHSHMYSRGKISIFFLTGEKMQAKVCIIFVLTAGHILMLNGEFCCALNEWVGLLVDYVYFCCFAFYVACLSRKDT